jgi:hypothetical protein
MTETKRQDRTGPAELDLLARHAILVEGSDIDACKNQVLHFFKQTTLVRYDDIVIEDNALSGEAQNFNDELQRAILRNREMLQGFIDELAATGFEKRNDLALVVQGYHSKVLHIIAHFLDGFIGIDSAFYNMIEDSHWLSEETRDQISLRPERFQLLFLRGYSASPTVAALLHT